MVYTDIYLKKKKALKITSKLLGTKLKTKTPW